MVKVYNDFSNRSELIQFPQKGEGTMQVENELKLLLSDKEYSVKVMFIRSE